MEQKITLRKVLSLGGQIASYKKDGVTTSIALTKFLKRKNIVLEENTDIVYLRYSKSTTILAIYIIKDKNDEDSALLEVYNKLNFI